MSDQEKQLEEPAEVEKIDALSGSEGSAVVASDVEVAHAQHIAGSHSGSSEVEASDEPQPTYVPAALAMGIMMLLWGILTNWIMSAAGAVVMAWAVAAWVREMHET